MPLNPNNNSARRYFAYALTMLNRYDRRRMPGVRQKRVENVLCAQLHVPCGRAVAAPIFVPSICSIRAAGANETRETPSAALKSFA